MQDDIFVTNIIKLSRSSLDLFLECPRCFWLKMNKVPRPAGFPYAINMAIDHLLKQEFDQHRESGTQHAIMKVHGINALPFKHPNMNDWRNTRKGIQFEHKSTGFLVFGAVDDIWVKPDENLIVVDYKATGAKEYNIYDSYKRQMEVYQWLFRKNSFKVSKTGYFLFAKVNKDKGFKNGTLSFDMNIMPCEGDDSWVEDAILRAKKCIEGEMPDAGVECKYCPWHFKQAA